MKNVLLVFFLFQTFSPKLFSQNKEPEFGKVDPAELNMKECSFEKNSDAMYMVKSAKISFENGVRVENPELYVEYWVRIKFFNPKGFEAASVKIPYSKASRTTKIKDIEAYIYNLDSSGAVVKEKLDRSEIFKEKGRNKNSRNLISFTFPNLKRNSIVEYRYTKVQKNAYSIPPWLFQDEYPVAFSQVSVATPSILNLNYHFILFESVQKDSIYKRHGGGYYDEKILSFTVRNIHAFKIEPFMNALKDNLQRVEFALWPAGIFGSSFNKSEDKWMFLNSSLLRSSRFGQTFMANVDSTESLVDSVKKIKDPQTRISSVYDFIRKNVEWDKELTFYCDTIGQCLKNKSGNSAEMNLLLLNLLKKVGINCFPILISTHSNGSIDEHFPSLSQFNSVDILATDSINLFILDCTQKGLSFKIPPQDVLNTKAFIIDPFESKWIYISDDRILMKNEVYIKAEIDSLGHVTGNTKLSLIGYAKLEALAKQDKKKNSKETEEEQANLSNNSENLNIDTVYEQKNSINSDTLIKFMNFHFTASNTANSYFINPFMFSYFKKNPFGEKERHSDIDLGSSQTYSMTIHLTVANNFSIESIPNAVSIRMADTSMAFKREVFQQENQLLIRTNFTINNYYFGKESYLGIKSFFEKVYALINEEILLKKKIINQ
jgi:hypothetical protein